MCACSQSSRHVVLLVYVAVEELQVHHLASFEMAHSCAASHWHRCGVSRSLFLQLPGEFDAGGVRVFSSFFCRAQGYSVRKLVIGN